MKLISLCVPDVGVTWGRVADGQALIPAGTGPAGLTAELTQRGGDLDSLLALAEERVGEEARARGHVKAWPLDAVDVSPCDAAHLVLPLVPPEVWGCGVTYRRSADERDADANKDIYTQVYESDRPEVFFKATPRCCVGPNEPIGIRSDSQLTAAEPELAVVLGRDQTILGYMICNDVSAWDLERANPLYLPQSKTFTGCCALGPALVTSDEVPDPYAFDIRCAIVREGRVVFEGEASTSQLGRRLEELVEYLARSNPVPVGTVLTTGTGIMIPNEFALREGDRVDIAIDGIGVLRNPVTRLSDD